jgi:hypothetical protein
MWIGVMSCLRMSGAVLKVIGYGGKGECTLLVSGKKTSCLTRSLKRNITSFIDYDDTRPGPLTHTGAVVVPSSWPWEKLELQERDTPATVLGYESVFRIGVVSCQRITILA